jgi:hypothetical protein
VRRSFFVRASLKGFIIVATGAAGGKGMNGRYSDPEGGE